MPSRLSTPLNSSVRKSGRGIRAMLLVVTMLATSSLVQGQTALKALVSLDPADQVAAALVTTHAAGSLSKELGTLVQLPVSSDLKDALRATRTGENGLLIGPPHVVASALAHGYTLVAVSGHDVQYALVARDGIQRMDQLRGGRLYLPQADSLRSYVAKGLLEQGGLTLRALKQVDYRSTSGAGLIALGLGMTDATIAEQSEAQAWIQAHPGKARVLQVSRAFPGGLSMVMHQGIDSADQGRIQRWALTASATLTGHPAFRRATTADTEKFDYIAGLGIVTPLQLEGVTVLDAQKLQDLMARTPALAVVDTRSQKEYLAGHIERAVWAPYLEKSLKERDYDPALDDFSAILKLDRNRPVVFLCNGPECWKSYKAAHQARQAGFQQVHWFRGGMPEWRAGNLPVVQGH